MLEQLDIWRPHVWEFARLEITYVQLSKRKILKLVQDGTVRGWDDPCVCSGRFIVAARQLRCVLSDCVDRAS